MMQLGLVVVYAATSIRKQKMLSSDELMECYGLAAAAMAFSISMNVLRFQVSKVPTALHALRQGPRAGNLWQFSQFLFLSSVALCSAGFVHIVDNLHTSTSSDNFGRVMASAGASGALMSIIVMDIVNDAPWSWLRQTSADAGQLSSHQHWGLGGRRTRRVIANTLGMVVSACLWGLSDSMMALFLALDSIALVVVVSAIKKRRYEMNDESTQKHGEHETRVGDNSPLQVGVNSPCWVSDLREQVNDDSEVHRGQCTEQ